MHDVGHACRQRPRVSNALASANGYDPQSDADWDVEFKDGATYAAAGRRMCGDDDPARGCLWLAHRPMGVRRTACARRPG